MYAYVVGGVCQVISSLDVSTAVFHKTMDTLNEYMEVNSLPKKLRQRLREYFHRSRAVQQEEHFKTLLHKMSPGLRGDISLHNHNWISKIQFFRSGNTEEQHDFIVEVALCLTAVCYAPSELVVRKGSHNTNMYVQKLKRSTNLRNFILIIFLGF